MIHRIIKQAIDNSGIMYIDDIKEFERMRPNMPTPYYKAIYINPDIVEQGVAVGHKFNEWERTMKTEMIVINNGLYPYSDAKLAQLFFHELAHATGREGRLNRVGHTQFFKGSPHMREEEELIAEIASGLLMEHFGLATKETRVSNQEYLEFQLMWIPTSLLTELMATTNRRAGEATAYILDNWIKEIEFLQEKAA
jgi:hypothetical protein